MRRRGVDRGRARYAMAATASALVLAACSLTLDANAPQCSTTADCVGRGAAFAEAICVDSRCAAKPPVTTPSIDAGATEAADELSGPFRCVGHVTWPAATSEPLIDHEVFVQGISGKGVAGLTVKSCGAVDVDCASPISTVQTDATGAASIPITKGFAGYLHLGPPPASFPALSPTIYAYVFPPGAAPGVTSHVCPTCAPEVSTPVVSTLEIGALASFLGISLDTSRGMLFLTALDCDNRPHAGIQVSLEQADGKVKRFYLQDGLPNAKLTETSVTGSAGFGNVPAGVVSVTLRLGKTGTLIGRRTVLVRAGTLTIMHVPPTPL